MPPVSTTSDDDDNSGDYPPLTDQGTSLSINVLWDEANSRSQMLEYSIKSSPAHNNPQTLKHYHFAPYSQPMIVSSRSTAWTRTMIRSICASCSVSEIRRCPANRCTKASRRFWRNSDSRSNFIQAETEIGSSRQISALMKVLKITQVCNRTRMARPAMTEGAHLSIHSMMQTPRISNLKPCALHRERPHCNTLSAKMRAKGIDQKGPAHGRQEGIPDDQRAPNLSPQKQGGVG